MSDFDQLAMSITPDHHRAMILLEETSRGVNKEQALDLVRQVVNGQVRFEILRAEYPAVYAQLEAFYRQDPAARLDPVAPPLSAGSGSPDHAHHRS